MAGTLHEDQYTFLSHLAEFVLEWKMFQTKLVEKIKNTHFIFNNFFPPENRAVYDIMRKNIVQHSKATDDNMAQAPCMLDA